MRVKPLLVVFLLGVCANLTAQNAAQSNVTGTLNGAVFRIEVPANWNKGGLVMYCHGYQPPGSAPINHESAQVKALREVFLSRGFAFAQSDYSTNPFDNRNTIYGGFDNDAAVNRGLKRYAADPKAREYIRQYYTPTGRVSDPVLTIHTTYDQLVPARDVSYYDVITAVAGTQDLFVARFVAARGHCNITAPRIGAAFQALLDWNRNKKRPAAGEIP